MSRLVPVYYPAVLGKGIRFPVQYSAETGSTVTSTVTSETMDKVIESIYLILCTNLGEYRNKPDFGSMLRRFLFAPLNTDTRSLIERAVLIALETWEKRIENIVAEFLTELPGDERNELPLDKFRLKSYADMGIEWLKIEFRLIRSQQAGNCVFPFYKAEDMGIMGYGYVYPRGSEGQ